MKFETFPIKSQINKDKISFSEKLAYGCGGLADVGISVAMSAYLLYYYTDITKVSAAVVGTIFLVSRLLGAFFDILIGLLMDMGKSKGGKARPWLLHMCLPLAVSGTLLFSSPNFSDVGKYAYIFVTYTVTNFLLSSLNISYSVLNSLMTQNPNERSSLNIFRTVISLVGTLLINNYMLPIVKFLGGGRVGWQLASAFYGICAVLFYLITYGFTKERVAQKKAVKRTRVPTFKDLNFLRQNKYFFMLFLVAIASYILAPLSSGIKIYYAQYVLGNKALMGVLTTANTLPKVAVMFFISPLVKKFGKRNLVIMGLLTSVIGILIQALNPYSIFLAVAGNLLRGVGNAPITGLSMAMLADTTEYGYFISGIRGEGILFSMMSFGKKIGSAIGSALLPLALSLSGYSAHNKAYTASSIHVIKYLYLALPLTVLIFQIAVLSQYKLDKEYPEILNNLKKQEAK